MINLEQVLSQELRNTVEQVRSNIRRANQSATGRTEQALGYGATNNLGYIEGAPWTWTLEKGRPPARSSSASDKREFIENLKVWIRAKGITYRSDKELERLANFFRWYINRFGNKLYRSGGRSDIISPPFDDLERRLMEVLPEYFTTVIQGLF